MSNLDIYVSFLDRTFSLVSLPNGNLVSKPIKHAQYGDEDEITSITHILNCNLIATGSLNGQITLYNASNAHKMRKILAHSSRVNAVCGLPNGFLASGAYELSIKIWNVTSETPLVKNLPGNIGYVHSLRVLPNGFLASSDTDNNILIWDVSTSNLIQTITSHLDLIHSLSVLFTNQYLLDYECLENAKIWSPSGQLMITIDSSNKKSDITALCVVSDESIACGDSSDNTIKIWNTSTGELINVLIGHSQSVSALYLLPNGCLISGSMDSSIIIWDLITGNCIKRLN